MILLTILTLIALMLLGVFVLVVSVGGTMFAIVFGDIFVCFGAIVALIVWLIKRRHKK